MDLHLTTSYEATPEEMFAIITDVTFQEQVLERLGAPSYDVTTLDAGDDLELAVRWEAPSDDVSAVVRRFVGDRLVLAQHKIWHPAAGNGAREADVEGETLGTRVKVTGRTSIVPSGRGTTQSFHIHVVASVPAIGHTLERVVTDAVRSRLEAKFDVAWSWIAGSF